MTTQIAAWLVAALLVFWCVGAYNRLVSLRNRIANAFAPVDAQLQLRHALLARWLQALPMFVEHAPQAADAVQAASAQLQVACDALRSRPSTTRPAVSLRVADETLAAARSRFTAELPARPQMLAAATNRVMARHYPERLGYALILLFGVALSLLPVAGAGDWRYLVLPVLTLGVSEAASLTRLTRANMLEILEEDYIRTARAKGVPGRSLLFRHALRNALNPLVTLAGVRVGRLIGGAVIVETIFARPGIGQLVVDSIHDRDYPMIQGFVVFMGTVFAVANLVVDLSYAWLDPRVRLNGRTGQAADNR